MNRYHVAGQAVNLTKSKSKKKKAPKNAFSFFLDDAMKEFRRKGQAVASKGEAVPLVHDQWKNMTADEKAPYESRAKEWKLTNRPQARPGRLDCTGQPIDSRVDMVDYFEKKRKDARKMMRSMWPTGTGVCDVHFYIISFQSLFELPDEEGYQPCEVACVDYTLNSGIIRVWHQFIDPGPIKLGLRAEVKLFQEKTHKIPEQNFEKASSDYHMIWDELLNFIKPDRNLTNFPPIYTKMAEIRKTEFCLNWLSSHARMANRLGKVYEMEDMAAELHVHAGMLRPMLAGIEDGCNCHLWDYESNTSCDYHNEIECIHCAILTVKKCCYFMSEALSKIYGFAISDQHLPMKKPAPCIITQPKFMKFGDYPRRNNDYRINPLSPQRNNIEPLNEFNDPIAEDPSTTTYGSRDIRYRSIYNIVASKPNCTLEHENDESDSLSVQCQSSGSTLMNASSLNHLVPEKPKPPCPLPSKRFSRRPISSSQITQKQSGILAANFQNKLKPSSSTSSCVHIDSLSEDFIGNTSISSAGSVRNPIAMLGRGRGRGRIYPNIQNK